MLWREVQNDFSGGEVGARVIMRDEQPGHRKSVLEMLNFMMTLQGTATRTPGTRFVYEVPGNPETVRLFPYLTPNNKRALVEMTPHDGVTPGTIRVIEDIKFTTDPEYASQIDVDGGSVTAWRQIVQNYQLRDGFFPWNMQVEEYTGRNGDQLGWRMMSGNRGFSGTARDWKAPDLEEEVLEMENSFIVPENCTTLILDAHLRYASNFAIQTLENEKTASLEIRSASGGAADIFTYDLTFLPISATFKELLIVNGTFTAGQELFIAFKFEAIKGEGKDAASVPNFEVYRLGVMAPVTVEVASSTSAGQVDYTADQLNDVQFVQSPYTDSTRGNTYGKQIVFAQGDHPPMELVYANPGYSFRLVFADDATQHYAQWNWDTRGYPAACTSYNGRLVLAGTSEAPQDTPLGGNNEEVWCTEIGNWSKFTTLADILNNPQAFQSVHLATTYRSPIQWVIGQKRLLIGAESMEYNIKSEGIFQNGDIDAEMQTTHGSSRVQPVGMGQYILFAAEAGRKLRSMKYFRDDDGWIAPDLTLAHPELFNSGIVRMVRMRNPHQITVVVKGDGDIAILHQDTYANIMGWSRIHIGANIVDATVLTDSTGADVLYMAVRRRRAGSWRLFIEAIPLWYEGEDWNYLNSSVIGIHDTPTNTISGLDHLEGRFVDVVADDNYYGSFKVSGGAVTLVDEFGQPINVTQYSAGLAMTARLRTLPLVTKDPKSKKRYTEVTVRTLRSGRPIINGERDYDREPNAELNKTQPLDVIHDNIVDSTDFDPAQVIEIVENKPVRCEVVGIFGRVVGGEA